MHFRTVTFYRKLVAPVCEENENADVCSIRVYRVRDRILHTSIAIPIPHSHIYIFRVVQNHISSTWNIFCNRFSESFVSVNRASCQILKLLSQHLKPPHSLVCLKYYRKCMNRMRWSSLRLRLRIHSQTIVLSKYIFSLTKSLQSESNLSYIPLEKVVQSTFSHYRQNWKEKSNSPCNQIAFSIYYFFKWTAISLFLSFHSMQISSQTFYDSSVVIWYIDSILQTNNHNNEKPPSSSNRINAGTSSTGKNEEWWSHPSITSSLSKYAAAYIVVPHIA